MAAACGGGTAPVTTSTAVVTTEQTTPTAPSALAGMAEDTIEVGGATMRVVVAASGAERRRGLMGIDDLGPFDGMLFVFDGDTASGFWMKDTLLPLDIAFFTSEGTVVDSFTMEPCAADPCPVYSPAGRYRFALEVPAGSMPPLDGEVPLVLDPG